jgi:ribonuclease-3
MSLKIELANRFVAASFGYVFKDNSLLKQALDTTGLRVRESNQRLALLGDRIIAFLVTDAWYSTGTSKGGLSHPHLLLRHRSARPFKY